MPLTEAALQEFEQKLLNYLGTTPLDKRYVKYPSLLTEINLVGDNLGASAQTLQATAALLNWATIEKLNLSHNNFTNQFPKQLEHLFHVCCLVAKELAFSHNPIGNQGFEAIMHERGRPRALSIITTRMTLEDCDITKEGFTPHAIERLAGIQKPPLTLDLSGNEGLTAEFLNTLYYGKQAPLANSKVTILFNGRSFIPGHPDGPPDAAGAP